MGGAFSESALSCGQVFVLKFYRESEQKIEWRLGAIMISDQFLGDRL